MPVVVEGSQVRQEAVAPLPITILLEAAQLQTLSVELQIRFAETHLQTVELSLESVKAAALLQLKQVNVFPLTIIAMPLPQSQ